MIPVEVITKEGFELTAENVIDVMQWLMDSNKPGGREVMAYVASLPDQDLIMAINAGLDAAEADHDQDWLYFIHIVMQERALTFEQLDRSMPDLLKNIIEE